jgi:hypothetical protein
MATPDNLRISWSQLPVTPREIRMDVVCQLLGAYKAGAAMHVSVQHLGLDCHRLHSQSWRLDYGDFALQTITTHVSPTGLLEVIILLWGADSKQFQADRLLLAHYQATRLQERGRAYTEKSMTGKVLLEYQIQRSAQGKVAQ